ncbi:SUMO-conjugating enzyme SCE1-like [Panicum miliaceum]|uniref:SUMO-conjugating enzyme SCE1-like n=1 Tax=Panicum miliaceum TaxID=4540 RepID=A0A3L6PZG6_PANMI|nr:SUMO-conjugating enzyme SCE1-like [Panicum miliaceum]
MASGGVARGRLAEERKTWRRSHPHGFVAKPETLPDGSVNLMVWKCVVPGKEGAWKASITVSQILIGIQELLDHPNPASPAQSACYQLYKKAEQAALIQPKLVNERGLSGPDLKVLPIIQLTIWETTILGYKSMGFAACGCMLRRTKLCVHEAVAATGSRNRWSGSGQRVLKDQKRSLTAQSHRVQMAREKKTEPTWTQQVYSAPKVKPPLPLF